MAVNAVKGLLGGDDKAHAEVDKHAKEASNSSSSSDDSISKALESLRKSGQLMTVDCLASASLGWIALLLQAAWMQCWLERIATSNCYYSKLP